MVLSSSSTPVLSAAVPAAEETTDSTPIDSTTTSSDTHRYGDCGVTVTCFGFPTGCISSEDCEVFARTQVKENGNGAVTFELYGKVEPEKRWFAIGLSHDDKMGNDSVSECILNKDQKAVLRQSWNGNEKTPHMNSLVDHVEGVTELEAKFENDHVYCKWDRSAQTTVHDQLFDFKSQVFHILLAHGALKPETDEKMYHKKGKSVSKREVDMLADPKASTADPTTVPPTEGPTETDAPTTVPVETTTTAGASQLGAVLPLGVLMSLLVSATFL
jgi:hypothetical protein